MNLIVISSEDPKKISETINIVLAKIREVYGELSEDDIFDIRLCLDEAIRNAMYHGNKNSDNLMVEISHEIEKNNTKNVLKIKIADEGEGFNLKNVPDPTTDENLFEDHGRGIFIIKKLMDELEYNEKGNILVMKKILKG